MVDDSPAARLRTALESRDVPAVAQTLGRRVLVVHDHGDSSSGIFRGRRSAAALIGILERVGATAVQQSAVNGEPGIVLRDACGDVVGVLALDLGRRRFRSVWVCTAPQKLRGWRRSDPADGDVTSEDPPLSTL